MKKFLSILFLCALTASAMAQNTSPRFIVYGSQDASSISFGQAVLADVASATLDTVKLRPRHQQPEVNLTVSDSCILYLASLAGCYQNDHMYVYITNPAQTGTLYLNGNWVVSTGTKTIALTANKHCLFEYWFDGANWIETSRNLNY